MSERPRYRKRGLMTEEILERALYWVLKIGCKAPLALHNFGEPLLHPKFDDYAIRFANKGIPITMSTNGTFLNEEWADRLAKVPWEWISVSPWDNNAKERASGLLINRGIKLMYPPGATHNWAGTSKGENTLSFKGCEFLDNQYCVIRWNGDVATCCISDRDVDKCGHVSQEPEDVFIREYDICSKCHMKRG